MFRKESMRIKKQNYKILKNHIMDHLCIKQMLIRTNQVEKIQTELNSLESFIYSNPTGSLNNPSFDLDNTRRIRANSESERRLNNNENSILVEMKNIPLKTKEDSELNQNKENQKDNKI
jgi:hypothetical protein